MLANVCVCIYTVYIYSRLWLRHIVLRNVIYLACPFTWTFCFLSFLKFKTKTQFASKETLLRLLRYRSLYKSQIPVSEKRLNTASSEGLFVVVSLFLEPFLARPCADSEIE